MRLTETDGHLEFEVCDDGNGFDPTAHGVGAGLQNMIDRLGAVGGEVAVRSRPGHGTTVSGRIPVDASAGQLARPPID
jgi:signal transduction histidine kinase